MKDKISKQRLYRDERGSGGWAGLGWAGLGWAGLGWAGAFTVILFMAVTVAVS